MLLRRTKSDKSFLTVKQGDVSTVLLAGDPPDIDRSIEMEIVACPCGVITTIRAKDFLRNCNDLSSLPEYPWAALDEHIPTFEYLRSLEMADNMHNTALNIVFNTYLASPQTETRSLALYLYRTPPRQRLSVFCSLSDVECNDIGLVFSTIAHQLCRFDVSKIVYLMSSSRTSVYSTGESRDKSRDYSPGPSRK